MRVMLDTNILISSLVFRSKTIALAIEDVIPHHDLLISSYVIDEFLEVVERSRKAGDTFLRRICAEVR